MLYSFRYSAGKFQALCKITLLKAVEMIACIALRACCCLLDCLRYLAFVDNGRTLYVSNNGQILFSSCSSSSNQTRIYCNFD